MRVLSDEVGCENLMKCPQRLINCYLLSVTWANEIYKRANFFKYLYADLLKFLGNFKKKNALRLSRS